MLKKIFMYYLAISIVASIVFGGMFYSRTYFERFQNFPDFMAIFNDLVVSFNRVGISFTAIRDLVSFFVAVGNVFAFIFELIKVPFLLIHYIIEVLLVILPIDIVPVS